MKKWLLLLVCFPAFLYAQEKTMVYDANAAERTLPAFSELIVEGGIDVFLSPFQKQAVAVSARDLSTRNRILTKVEGKTLRIGMSSRNGLARGDLRLRVYISVPHIEKLKANGASDIFVNGILTGDELSIQLNGASDFSGAIEVKKLIIQQTGASDSRLSGRVGELQVLLSGASGMRAYNCVADVLQATLSGASSLQATVNRELMITASGASDVHYKGNGVVKKLQSTGASTVRAVTNQ